MNLDRFEWLSQVHEEAVDPDREIVDPHHHLWDRGGSTYLADQLLDDTTSAHRVTHTVFVECMANYREDGPVHLRPVGETEFVVAEAVKMESRGGTSLAGIVSFADLCLGAAVVEVLDAHEESGRGLFRGIRYATACDGDSEIKPAHTKPPPGLMSEAAFLAGAAVLAERGYSFDAWLYHPQLPELTAMARDLPGLTIVLNHLGAPLRIGRYSERYDDVLSEWKKSLTDLAACPNVVLKVGGVGMDSFFDMGWADRSAPPNSDEVADHWKDPVRWCIDTFTPNRCMFESNYPVDRQTLPYAVLWNSFQKMVADYDDDEQDALFAQTARRVYRVA